MDRITVTVRRKDGAQEHDLEVSSEVSAKRLAELVARALHWDSDAPDAVEYEIVAEPPGRALDPGESLADAGVWDGARLVFQLPSEEPAARAESAASARSPAADNDQPINGWRPLDIPLPTDAEPPEGTASDKPGTTGFVWKQVD